MTTFDDGDITQAERLAASYVRVYLETDATFADITSRLDLEGPDGYVGRRRARECPNPALHARLERTTAQEYRPPSQALPGCCQWCDGLLPEGAS